MAAMTIKELKDLFKELRTLSRKQVEIVSNDDLSRNQMNAELEKVAPRLQSLLDIMRKYSNVFKVEARTLGETLKQVFSEEIKDCNVGIVHKCNGETADVEHFYGYHHYFHGTKTMKLELVKNNDSELLVLFNEETSEDLRNSLDFILGHYKVDLYELLINDDIKYAGLIHKACWQAIEKSVKLKNEEEVKSINEKESLIKQRIKELQKQEKTLQNKKSQIENNSDIIFKDNELKI